MKMRVAPLRQRRCCRARLPPAGRKARLRRAHTGAVYVSLTAASAPMETSMRADKHSGVRVPRACLTANPRNAPSL